LYSVLYPYLVPCLDCPAFWLLSLLTTHKTNVLVPGGIRNRNLSSNWSQTLALDCLATGISIRSPDRSGRSESLYRLSYPDPPYFLVMKFNVVSCYCGWITEWTSYVEKRARNFRNHRSSQHILVYVGYISILTVWPNVGVNTCIYSQKKISRRGECKFKTLSWTDAHGKSDPGVLVVGLKTSFFLIPSQIIGHPSIQYEKYLGKLHNFSELTP
jgi:hypothetical protein